MNRQMGRGGRGASYSELERLTQNWTAPVVIRTYEGKQAAEQFEQEMHVFVTNGYMADSQREDGGHVHVGRLLATGGLSILAGRAGIRSKGRVTVTFRRAVERSTEPIVAPTDLAAQLERLAALHSKGALTDEEFAAAKARALADTQ